MTAGTGESVAPHTVSRLAPLQTNHETRTRREMTAPTDTDAAAEMAHAETLPQLDASSLIDGDRLEAEVKEMYRHVAGGEDSQLHFEVGRELAEHLGYDPALLDEIPARAVASFAGVGHHLDFAALSRGNHVL